jgi:NAD(P)-dependent dehydrogenase (short-subunit alcohol dehydrogenase family)
MSDVARKVLVTGGTSGLGLAMASALAAAGAAVVLTGRDGARAAAVAAKLPGRARRPDGAEPGGGAGPAGGAGPGGGAEPGDGAGPGVVGIEMDVRDEVSVARGVEQAWSRLGGIDMLVNNAGIGMRTVNPEFMTRSQAFWEVPVDGFRAVVETNLTGYFLVAREVTPRMLATGGGRIVNISVNSSTMQRAGFVPYGPSRAGSEAMSRVMAADLRDTGVTVNLLLPGGATVTGMVPPGAVTAGQRFLEPAVMGPPIVWLASAEAAGVHDERIVAAEFDQWLSDRKTGVGGAR